MPGHKQNGSIWRPVALVTLLVGFGVPALGAPDIKIHPVQLPDDLNYWPDAGFVDMVGPTRLPTEKSIQDHIAVWVRLPEKGVIKVTWLPDQKRYTLLFPPGTVADRVESMKNAKQAMLTINGIQDVRGARIGADGQTWFHDYEPVPGTPGKWLKGFEWLRSGGPVGDDLAADSLIKLFYPGAPAKAKVEIAQYRRLNQCGACHVVNRPAPTSTEATSSDNPRPRLLLSMTDADGFYQPITVMTDTMVVRNHRPWGLNADDPYITVMCGDQRIAAITNDGARYYVCADGKVPTGTLDMASALQHKDPHAFKVCKARNYLYEHMDAEGKKIYKKYYVECKSA